MRRLVNLLQRALDHRDVRAAAVVGTERRLMQGRFDDRAEAVMELAQMARQLFRETRPAPAYADLELEEGRLVLVPVGDAVLVLEADRRFEAPQLLAGLADALAEVAGGTELTRRLSSLPAGAARGATRGAPASAEGAPAGPELAELLMVLNEAVGVAKAHLGGPVVRNYLKKAREALLEGTPQLASFEVTYDGIVTADALAEEEAPALAEPVRAWVAAFFAHGAERVPALGAVDVDEITAGLVPSAGPPPTAERRIA